MLTPFQLFERGNKELRNTSFKDVMAAGRNYTPLGYCDQTDIENFLLITIDPSFSSQVSDWIATAEGMVNQILNYPTASGVLTEVILGEESIARVDSESNLMVFTRKNPIQSVEAITLKKGTTQIVLTLNNSQNLPKYEIPTGMNYILYPNYEFSISGSSVIQGFHNLRFHKFFVKVDYTAGFTPIPAPIRQATVNLVADMVMRHTNKEGLESITQGRVTKRWMFNRQIMDRYSEFYFEALRLLKPYIQSSAWLV